MKIAQIAPLYEAVPPKLYGGTERVVGYLCDALVALGHEVTLFASGDSQTAAQLVPVREKAIRLDDTELKSDLAAHLTELDEVRRQSARFDILHFHVEMLHFPLFEPLAHKTVTTLHGRLDYTDLPTVYERWRDFGLVSISNSQRAPLPRANWLATVPHGIPENFCSIGRDSTGGGYLAFLGRISAEKRPDVAARLALRAELPLKIAAKIDEGDPGYFASALQQFLPNPLIDFVGEIDEAHKSEFLGKALALIFPIDWPEPFGLVMIEAMACGTPVIAWNHGSVPEIVDDGLTGFIVNSEDQALQAVTRLPQLDRKRIRATFEKRFAAGIMASAYSQLFAQVLAGNRAGTGHDQHRPSG
jgi:glycosyltransferase involved in cell wall biosynthesis